MTVIRPVTTEAELEHWFGLQRSRLRLAALARIVALVVAEVTRPK